MTNTLENCTENLIESTKQSQHPSKKPELYYLIQIEGDPKFRLTAKSARKNGVKAEFLPAGWVYQSKKDAEEVANRWTQGKRKLYIVEMWDEQRLNAIWNGSKDEARLARKSIRVEIDSDRENKKRQEIILQCHKSPLHPSWLYSNDISKLESAGCSEIEIQAYKYFKPLWDKTNEEKNEIDLRTADIAREEEDKTPESKVGKEIFIGGIPKKITDMDSLDQRFAQLEAPGRPCVYINRIDAQPISFNDFSRRLSGEVIRVDSDGQQKYISASKFWEGNSRKCIYRKIVFTNNKVDNETYNLFTGFGIKPKKGKCEKILSHIKDVICSENEENSEALIKLLAWQIQNIGKPSRIIVLLKSEQHQAGKGALLQDILSKIYGNSGYVTNNLDQIIGRFNDTIRGKAYIFLDEALFAGDRKSADSIKSLSTATTIGVETKGVPSVQMPIAVNFFLSTNHKDAAHVEEGDARYWILDVSDHRVGDMEYFKSLYDEIEHGGREAFMDLILNLDVKNFIPMRDVPKDNALKQEMIKNSINPYDARKWLEDCCNTGMIMGLKPADKLPYEKSDLPWENWITGKEYDNGSLYVAYTEWQKSIKSPIAPKTTPSNKFGELLNNAGFDLPRIQAGKKWRKLPDPETCKLLLNEVLGKAKK